MPARGRSTTTATDVADEPRYVRIGWTDPALDGNLSQTDLAERVLSEWQRDRRGLSLVGLDGSRVEVQLLAFGPDVLYVADQDGQARLVFRQGLREIILHDRDSSAWRSDGE